MYKIRKKKQSIRICLILLRRNLPSDKMLVKIITFWRKKSIFVLSYEQHFAKTWFFFIVFISTKINDLNKMVFFHQNWINFSIFLIKIACFICTCEWECDESLSHYSLYLCTLLFGVTLFQYNNEPGQHLLCTAFVIVPKRKTAKNQIKAKKMDRRYKQ